MEKKEKYLEKLKNKEKKYIYSLRQFHLIS